MLTVSVQSPCLRSLLKYLWLEFLKFLVRIFLGFTLISARVGVIRNWAKWSEISIVKLPDIAFSLMLL